MLVDKLIKAVEKNDGLKSLRGVMSTAPIFRLDPDRVEEDNYEDIITRKREFFTLPYPETLVEIDNRDCAALVVDPDEDNVGVECSREVFSMVAVPKDARKGLPISYYAVWFTISNMRPKGDDTTMVTISPANFLSFDDDLNIINHFQKDGDVDLEQLLNEVGGNHAWPFMYLVYFRGLDRFIMESTPKKMREPGGKKIPRSHERREYSLYTPGEITKKYYDPSRDLSGRKKPDPHSRIRHWRRKNAELGWVRSNMVDIASTWVGEKVFVKGRKTHRVITNR